ncbi:MAG TPA: hypothetical protein VFZ53_05545 [Polyangiaceae bacterium]
MIDALLAVALVFAIGVALRFRADLADAKAANEALLEERDEYARERKDLLN